jgi:hypothetical protein
VCMPLVLRVTATMAGCEYGCGGYGWLGGVGVFVRVGWGLLRVLLRGVASMLGGCCFGVGSLLVWSGLEVLVWWGGFVVV